MAPRTQDQGSIRPPAPLAPLAQHLARERPLITQELSLATPLVTRLPRVNTRAPQLPPGLLRHQTVPNTRDHQALSIHHQKWTRQTGSPAARMADQRAQSQL